MSFWRSWTLGVLFILLVLQGLPPSRAALEQPVYGKGDRWTYDIGGNVGNLFAGDNTTGLNLSFDLRGRLQEEVLGEGEVNTGGQTVSTARVSTTLRGYLNGTAAFPLGNSSAVATGTITADVVEDWDSSGLLTLASRGYVLYDLQASLIIFTTPFAVNATYNTTHQVSFHGTLPLDVGANMTASSVTHTELTLVTKVLGQTNKEATNLTSEGTMRRSVVALESVQVPAGTFDAYILAQDAEPSGPLAIPGLPPATNDTAFFAPGVGNYVRRDLYFNGTQVANVQLRSFQRGIGFMAYIPWIAGGGAAAAAVLGTLAWWRTRRAKQPPPADNPPGGLGPP